MVNLVIIEGRLTADPDMRYKSGSSDICVASFNLACKKDFVKKGSNDDTDFISCVAFNKVAKAAEQCIHKGSHVIVVGRVANNNYTKDGKKYYRMQLEIEKMRFLDPKETEQTTGDGFKDDVNGEAPFVEKEAAQTTDDGQNSANKETISEEGES